MRLVLRLLLVAFCTLGEIPGRSAALERETLFGKDYVRLEEWAASRHFSFHWTTPRESFEVRGPDLVLAGEIDSRRITLHGVVTYLSYPVALNDGQAWISPGDISKVLRPMLRPSSQPAVRNKPRVLCIDAGHGGKDPGNRHLGLQEKDLTLQLALKLGTLLKKDGFKIIQTRTSDRYVEPEERPQVARKKKADLFLSLHFNAIPRVGGDVRGIETFALTPAGHPSTNERVASTQKAYPGNKQDDQNMLLAHHVQKKLIQRLGAEDRGLKRQRFVVLKDAGMPAVLIEGGFLSDAIESKRLADPRYLQRMAEAIREGVQAYCLSVQP